MERTQVQQAIASVEAPHAERSAAAVLEELDADAQKWNQIAGDACASSAASDALWHISRRAYDQGERAVASADIKVPPIVTPNL